ncbi:hypothetical protein RJ55_00567 [Drechmeria coniospora]|nr:hypothetical protein RJ55_00567 [Drechmeria coniospora]
MKPALDPVPPRKDFSHPQSSPEPVDQHAKLSATPSTTLAPDAGEKDKPLPPPPPSKETLHPIAMTGSDVAPCTALTPTAGTSLVPVTKRRPHPDKTIPRVKGSADGDRSDVAPDGTSAGREGRQFAVSNVGNNGRIYLRPSLRPSHQRYPQPAFLFPVTPPGTGGLDQTDPAREKWSGKKTLAELASSPWTSGPRPNISSPHAQPYCLRDSQALHGPTRPRRAMSESTIHELNAVHDADPDAFKAPAPKPTEDKRPRTMDDLDAAAAAPLLNISIPSWRIGTPRFTLKGTPVIRGTSYAPTEDFRSSSASLFGLPVHAYPPPPLPFSTQRGASGLPSPRPGALARLTYVLAHPAVIEPSMFSYLTFKPTCDDPAIVKYSPSGTVTAATPPRLVAEITSPSFLDYELISDFFLTFRSFLEPRDLLRMLVARLRWALSRTDEVGMVVRVRTFVAIRHWILNYFTDDFLLDLSLRLMFCNLLNEFFAELSQETSSRKVQLKILGELKKCWRRVCAQFWDGPDFDDLRDPEIPIAPGGLFGNRDPNPHHDAGSWAGEGVEPRRPDELARLTNASADSTSHYADAPRTANPIGDFIILGNRPGTPDDQAVAENEAGSPRSLASVDVVSCSLPGKAIKAANLNAAHPMAAHPVTSTAVNNGSAQVATTPKALTGKRVRPRQAHKRSNSFSDSLREHGSDKSSSHDQDFSTLLPSAGSLVRGNLLPPSQPYIDFDPLGPHDGNHRQTTICQSPGRGLGRRPSGGAMSGYGMKKLLGGVRRVLRTRAPGVSPTQADFLAASRTGMHGAAATNRLPASAVVPQDLRRQHGGRPPVRIDLLGAAVAEDFKKAVRDEEAAAEAERLAAMASQPSVSPLGGPHHYSAARMDSSIFDNVRRHRKLRTVVSDMGITVGSKSIVIVDDTVPFAMNSPQHRGLATANQAIDALADTFMNNAADPTPPNTPPANFAEPSTPRRQSHLVNTHVRRPDFNADALPPFIPDLATLESSRASEDMPRPSLSLICRRTRHPLSAGGSLRMHRKTRSAATLTSMSSVFRRRHNSFSSGVLPPSTLRSLGTSAGSGESAMEPGSEISMPAPLRVLRRRPGGDLRSATNVGDLDRGSLRRPQSVGSLQTYAESVRGSLLIYPSPKPSDQRLETGLAPGNGVDVRCHAKVDGNSAKRNLPFFRTCSSKPAMRPSFEKEAQMLAQIPDDEDGGGIECALAKLEGKYEKKVAPAPAKPLNPDADVRPQERRPDPMRVVHESQESPVGHRSHHRNEPEPGRTGARHADSFPSARSEESYCSIPLLERGLTDDGGSRAQTMQWTDRSILHASDDDDSLAEMVKDVDRAGQDAAQHLSFDFIQKTDSIKRISTGMTVPSDTGGQSFLDDDSADGIDLSSEIPGRVGNKMDALLDSYRPPDDRIPSLATSRASAHQLTLIQALAMSPQLYGSFDTRSWAKKPPSMPNLSQVFPQSGHHLAPYPSIDPRRPIPESSKADVCHIRKYSVHMPFILAFGSDILAQQFTLIEKDALNEIDWKELMDMNWKNKAGCDSRSWVEFLRNSDAHGVEVVIARFNIMVKWAISEIVLTQHAEERARCIIKLIHIASHCRRYRNFATLAQLTIALSSNEVSRLSKTWELVPAHDVKTLDSLEALVTPTRNFHAIRAEMEMGSDAGCIPFVGIYTHDLLFNAQRPSEIVGSPSTAPLVNFERCRIGAAVVKTLLRLLEASTRYSFMPIEGITERCLWIGALSDEEIREHSKSLEPASCS